MKVVKPQRLGVLSRTFEFRRQCYFSVGVLVFFPFEAPDVPLPEVALWKFLGAELGADGALDAGMPKPRGEVIVHGKAMPADGAAQAAVRVRVRLGPVDKSLLVVGDRQWRRGAMTAPAPFTEMPVTWARAFGGDGFPANPLGRGFAPKEGDPLPNVEHPTRRVVAPADRPAPVGLTPLDPMWPARAVKAGTYDDAWLKHDFPGLASDIDMSYFNVAPDDQQLPGYLRGDEAFLVEGMHPDHPSLEGRLPRAKARVFVTRRTAEGERFLEVPTRAETAWLFPHAMRGVVLHRGVVAVDEDDADDVLHLLVGAESPDDPRPEAHYRDVLDRRLDRERGAAFMLRDDELLPPRPEGAASLRDEAPSDVELLGPKAGLLRQRLRRRTERQLEQTRAQLASMGVDPDRYVPKQLPPEPPPPTAEQLPAVMDEARALMDRAKLDAAAQREEAAARARAFCQENGIDFEAALAKARKERAGPPKFTAEAELARMRHIQAQGRAIGLPTPDLDAKLADPALRDKLVMAESKMREMYRRYAHAFPAAERREGEEDVALREAIVRALEAGEALAGRDLTGADLSGLDLRGRDLRGAFLEAADLREADLTGADLTQAVLTRADLTGATLADASLGEANLGEARLRGVLLARARLAGAVLVKADVADANFDDADLTAADFTEATFAGASLRGVRAARANLRQTTLSRVSLARADLTKATLHATSLEGADLTGATLSGATFYRCKADRARFAEAALDNARVVEGSSFRGASFERARMDGANLRGADLEGAVLREASAAGADFSKCNLRGADLTRATLKGARLVRADLAGALMRGADLMEADLQKALLHGADLRDARMFRADLARARWDTATRFEGAMLNRVRRVAP